MKALYGKKYKALGISIHSYGSKIIQHVFPSFSKVAKENENKLMNQKF